MTPQRRLVVGALCVAVVLGSASFTAATLWSRQPTAQSVSQPPAEPETPEVAQPDETEVFTYDPEGRRDPFVSLMGRGTDLQPLSERPAGLAGLSVNEVSLRGIVFSNGRYLAVLQASDDRTYILRGEERLFDGSVKSIFADGVVFLEEVNDPLSLVKEREVRQTLGGAEEGR